MRGIKVLAMVMMLAAGMQAFAQNNTKRADKADRPTKEEIMKKRWQALAGRMMLTDKQTEQLEDTYCDYIKDLAQLKAEKRSDRKEAKKDMAEKKEKGKWRPTDEQVAEMTMSGFDMQRKRIDIKEKYFKEFSKVLSARQANYLLKHDNINPGHKKGMKRMAKKGMMPRKRFAPQA